jgi:Uma2 family endonuclease
LAAGSVQQYGMGAILCGKYLEVGRKAMQTMTPQQEFQRTLLELLPEQGSWSDEGYLWLTDHTNRLIEFTDGYIEVLPMPTPLHQNILQFLFLAFLDYIHPRGGKVHFAPLRLRIRPGKFREPDLLLLLDINDSRQEVRYWYWADLALEVVSDDKPSRDLVDKRFDYAELGIPEYWIANPFSETITVLRLEGAEYVEHGVFKRGERATSALLPDFAVDVSAALDAR